MNVPFLGRFFDFYLLWQLLRVWMYVFEALLIITVERFWRFGLLIYDFLVPSLVASLVQGMYRKYTSQFWAARGPPAAGGGDGAAGEVGPPLSVASSVSGVSSFGAASAFSAPPDPPELRYDSPQLIRQRGYPCEEHYVKTDDGFCLCVHRIPHGADMCSSSASSPRSSTADADQQPVRPVVFLHHGFLQSSEAWLSTAKNLPFLLSDGGFDVWLANARGNKYSCKHERYDPHQREYWDFGLDEPAGIDIPAVIKHILATTGVEKISYIGFSQGTAVGFAAFSLSQELQNRVNMFVALGPALRVKGFSNPLLDALCRSSPEIIYLLFGHRDLLPSTLFWQRHMPTRMFNSTITRSCKFLFGWDMANILDDDKPFHYAHIYSYSSVKTVVHWFQIMKTGRFQMYDSFRWRSHDLHMYCTPRYPVDQIKFPIAVFYGGRDHLPDNPATIDLLPKSTRVFHIPSYEHTDFMYARSAIDTVYPKIVDLCMEAAHGKPFSSESKQQQQQQVPDKKAKSNGLRQRRNTVKNKKGGMMMGVQGPEEQEAKEIFS